MADTNYKPMTAGEMRRLTSSLSDNDPTPVFIEVNGVIKELRSVNYQQNADRKNQRLILK